MGEAEMRFHGVIFFFSGGLRWPWCGQPSVTKHIKDQKGWGSLERKVDTMCDVDFLQISLLVRATCLWQSVSVGWTLLGHGILALCATIKRDDAFGSWVCCVSITCVSWLSTDDSAVKNQGPFSIVTHASNIKSSRENYKMESTMFWVCVCAPLPWMSLGSLTNGPSGTDSTQFLLSDTSPGNELRWP